MATLAWTLLAGKDMSWDVVNHHFYLPFSLVSGRYVVDLYAAGPQSYQNPLGYLPFYALVRAGLPAWVVGAALAALHALVIAWPLHRITRLVWGDLDADRWWRIAAVVMAWCAPVYLVVAGTSSVDPLCAGLVLIGAAMLLDDRAGRRALIGGGLALGLAVAIKPTSGVFALAIGAAGVVRLVTRQLRLADFAIFVGASVIGALAGAGWWAWWLWETFGSPTFPLFNQFFGSPYAPAGPTVAHRFLPDSLADWVLRPWQMAQFKAYTSTEGFVPDVRPAFGLAALGGVALLGWVRTGSAGRVVRSGWVALAARADAQLLVIIAAAYGLWMASSGNARYAVALFLMVGIGAVRAVALLRLPRRLGRPLIGVVVVAQTIAYAGSGDRRFLDTAWDGGPYLGAVVPPRLAAEPFLHLSFGVQTLASVASFLHPGGALINVSGQITLPRDGPLGEAVRQRLDAWQGRTRFLFRAPKGVRDPEWIDKTNERARFMAYHTGLQVDLTDCEYVWIVGVGTPPTRAGVPPSEATHGLPLMSCAALPGGGRDEAIEQLLARSKRVYDLIEARCPRLFAPRPMATDIGDGVVQRRYNNSDARVNVSEKEGVTLTHFRSLSAVTMGTIDHVIATEGRDACTAWQRLQMQ